MDSIIGEIKVFWYFLKTHRISAGIPAGLVFAVIAACVILVLAHAYRQRAGDGRRKKRVFQILYAAFCAACLGIQAVSLLRLFGYHCFAYGFMLDQIGQQESSIRFLRLSTQAAPSLKPSYLQLLEIYYGRNDLENAGGVLERMTARIPDAERLLEAADLSVTLGKLDAADSFYIKAMAFAPARVRAELGRAGILIRRGRGAEALSLLEKTPDSNPKTWYLRALASFDAGRYADAREEILHATDADPGDWESWLLRGKIHRDLGELTEGLASIQAALDLRRELPEAYRVRAEILFEQKKLTESAEEFGKAAYYDNSLADAAAVSRMLASRITIPLRKLRKSALVLEGLPREIALAKGDSISLPFTASVSQTMKDVTATVLPPYGFGIEAAIRMDEAASEPAGGEIPGILEITGLRDDSVNMNRPWSATVLFMDEKRGEYASSSISVSVYDRQEGRIYFVPTEDLEVNSAKFHPQSGDAESSLGADEAKTYFVSKLQTADGIAESSGVKWSHMIDIGSALLRNDWLAIQDPSGAWADASSGIRRGYAESVSRGNDIQLHIHAYNTPGSPGFSQTYDASGNRLEFGPGSAPDKPGAWASRYTSLGSYSDPASKMGSLFGGIRALESLLAPVKASYGVLAFRAGEYDFGAPGTAMRDSITSLRANGILCSSNAIEGASYLASDFSFEAPIGRNAYFSGSASITRRAQSLCDVGILEIVPVPKRFTKYYLQPTDSSRSIGDYVNGIRGRNKAFPPGVFVVMEQFHLNVVNAGSEKWDTTDAGYGDWAVMDAHFKAAENAMGRTPGSTISDAALAYYDYYTPDLITLRSAEVRVSQNRYSYPLSFIGRDIILDERHPHFVHVKPPSRLLGSIRSIAILRDGRVVEKWNNPADYKDLEFAAEAREGYEMMVECRQ